VHPKGLATKAGKGPAGSDRATGLEKRKMGLENKKKKIKFRTKIPSLGTYVKQSAQKCLLTPRKRGGGKTRMRNW